MPTQFRSPDPVALRDAGLGLGRSRRIGARLAEWVDERRLPGIALQIRRHGATLNWAVGQRSPDHPVPFDAGTRVRLYSVSKPLTSALLFTFFEDGRWAFDDPVSRWLPELGDVVMAATGRPPRRAPVLRDLLLHQAGLAYGLAHADGADEAERAYARARVLDFSEPANTLVGRVAALGLIAEPGTHRYSVAHDLLGLVAERIGGLPLDVLFAERLCGPLGLRGTGFAAGPGAAGAVAVACRHDADGRAVPIRPADADPMDWPLEPPPALKSGGAGVVSTLDDLATLVQALAQGEAGPPLAAATRRLMQEPTDVPAGWLPGAVLTPGWWTRLQQPAAAGCLASPGTLFTHGGGGCFAWFDPAQDLLVAATLCVTGWRHGAHPLRQIEPLVYQALDAP